MNFASARPTTALLLSSPSRPACTARFMPEKLPARPAFAKPLTSCMPSALAMACAWRIRPNCFRNCVSAARPSTCVLNPTCRPAPSPPSLIIPRPGCCVRACASPSAPTRAPPPTVRSRGSLKLCSATMAGAWLSSGPASAMQHRPPSFPNPCGLSCWTPSPQPNMPRAAPSPEHYISERKQPLTTASQLTRPSQLKNSVLQAIGNTPLVKLQKVVTKDMADVVVKLRYYIPTSSYKDRMALAMIEGAEKRGALRPGMRVVEYTGGSTGSSLALVCSIKGYPFTAVSSDGFAREKLQTMEIFGADLRIIPSDQGKLTPELFRQMIDTAENLGREPNSFYCNQFRNQDAVEGYKTIGHEIYEQVGDNLAAFCGAVGTAGMLVGVSRALKACGSKTRIIALEPASSPVLTTGKGGPHRVEGIAAGFRPPHLQDGDFDEARTVEEKQAREMAHRLAREEGIFAGTSSGLNVVAALQLARELGPGKTVATVAVDSGFKYLAGDLFQS